VESRIADLERARDAVARGAWSEAYGLLQPIDPFQLGGADLEGLAEAAWWGSRIDESMSARQGAYSAYLAEGDEPRAASMALRLFIEHVDRGQFSIGSGWLERARTHLRGKPVCVQHGYLELIESAVALEMSQMGAALVSARRGRDIGRRFADPDLTAMAIVGEGLAVIASGRVDEGSTLLDEAMTFVVAGGLSPFFTGVVYCRVIDACLGLGDIRRAADWSEGAREWCRSIPPESPFPGLCRANRAEVARLHGDWNEAEAEAMRATEELAHISPEAAAFAFNTLGNARTSLRDISGAETAFARASELGLDPQPGLSLLRLTQGKVEAARTALRVALGDQDAKRPRRATLLAVQVETEIAAGDLVAAAAACAELESIADDLATPALKAMAASARGSVALAEGATADALAPLRRARAAWRALRMPFETAQAHARYGIALREAGDEDDALLELRVALTIFERLGAASEAARVSELMRGPGTLPFGLTAREAEVLRLVASGKTNRDIAVELVISEHTVARHVQNIFGKLNVSSRSAATAFAFESGFA
jgi:DNA-binding CsgD family transcriptional regulator